MSDARWQRLRRVFDAAIAMHPDERAAYVRAQCADDESLREEVESLLASHDAPDSAEQAVDRARQDMARGDTIVGPYELGEKIGEGGFGEVYRAEQVRPFRRTVALKIVKLGMDSRQVIARFEAERQALALMDHPHVATVFDAGTTATGRPYFAMELVDGLPITEYCRGRSLAMRERLQLFVRVCRAVQHAHQRGIIHRDLKPANILVSRSGDTDAPKVIDFGIAKAVAGPLSDSSFRTGDKSLLGTPEYMSPEQFRGDGSVDTRSDIYALGIILYELLTGRTPLDSEEFRSSSLAEMERAVVENEAERPSTIQPGLSRELDWITLKALEKDRERRYPSAGEMAADVERFLTHQPVSAVRPTAAYRFRKFVRRNRALVGGAAAVTVALFAGAVVSVMFALGQARALRIAEEQSAVARAINDFLVDDVLAAADPYTTGKGDATMRDVIDAAATKLDGRFQDQAGIKGAVHAVIGRVYGALNRSDEAIRHLESAADWLAKGGAAAGARADVQSKLSLVQEEAGRYDEALRYADEGIRLLGDLPEDPVRSSLEARRAFSLMRVGRLEEAKAAASRHVAMQDRIMGEGSFAAAKSRSLLASVHYNLSEYPEALKYQEPVFRACRDTLGPDHGETLDAQNNLAIYLSYAKRYDEAIELARDLQERNRRVFGEDHPKAATALWILAQAYYQRGDLKEALASHQEVTATFARTIGADHPASLNARTTEAEILHRLGRSKEAAASLRTLFEIKRDRLGPTHNSTIQTVIVYAPALMAIGRAEEARKVTAASVTAFEKEDGPTRFPEGLVNQHLGIALAALGRHGEAEAALLRAREVFLEVHGEEHSRTREATKALAEFYAARGRPEEAAHYEAAAETK